MYLTFTKWPHLLFYDYFERCNKVFSENGDFAEKIYAFYKVKIAENKKVWRWLNFGLKIQKKCHVALGTQTQLFPKR